MKWVLIAVFITSDASGFLRKGFSFQEFESKESCETAIGVAKDMAKSVRGEDGTPPYQLRCVKK